MDNNTMETMIANEKYWKIYQVMDGRYQSGRRHKLVPEGDKSGQMGGAWKGLCPEVDN